MSERMIRADGIELATQSFGQGISATALQVAAAYGALANGGVLMKPYLVSKVTDGDGLVLLENKPTALRRVVTEKSAKSVIASVRGIGVGRSCVVGPPSG